MRKIAIGLSAWLALITIAHVSMNVNWAIVLNDRLPLDKGPTSTLLRAFSGEKGKRYDEVRREVAAVSIGLYRADVAGISCPVFAPAGVLAGAVTLTGPSQRFDERALARMQVMVRGMTGERHSVTCNGIRIPLHPTGTHGEFVAGVRYRAWQPPNCLHPTIPVHTPLVFDLLDSWNDRSMGGCTYHAAHPGGLSHESFPVNSYEAEARRLVVERLMHGRVNDKTI